jgi:excisionase family DNA binding protein
MPSPAPQPAYTWTEVATRLRVSRDTIRREVEAGHLRSIRVGHHAWRILDADLDAYIAERASSPEPERVA